MRYYEVKIIRPMFAGNLMQGKTTTVYISLKDQLTAEMLEQFNWTIRGVYTLSPWKYAWYLLTKPVTNHNDCFNFLDSVVIE